MVVLVFALVQSQRMGGPPTLFGYQFYIIAGGSMSPTFEAGSLAIVKSTPADEVNVGDVITYRGTSADAPLTTHRVRKIIEEGAERSFITRGDANLVDDAVPVTGERLVGRVAHTIPYAGELLAFGRTRRGLMTLVIVPGLVIIGFEVRTLLKLSGQLEQQKKEEQEEETSEQVSA
jgi:signal peptidase